MAATIAIVSPQFRQASTGALRLLFCWVLWVSVYQIQGFQQLCFRFVAPNMDDPQLNVFNQELLARIQESGIAVPSQTTLHGRFALRCAIVNHRSRREDCDLLVQATERIGAEMMEQL